MHFGSIAVILINLTTRHTYRLYITPLNHTPDNQV